MSSKSSLVVFELSQSWWPVVDILISTPSHLQIVMKKQYYYLDGFYIITFSAVLLITCK